MSEPAASKSGASCVLRAESAAELMRTDLVSLRDTATVVEATATLTQRGLNACPVVDAAGRPLGVVSKADILIHQHQREQPVAGRTGEQIDSAIVRDIMTPAVFSVAPETKAPSVVEQMVQLKVHQLFVVDQAGVLVGVVGTHDILERLRP